jgi:hypothetical protein
MIPGAILTVLFLFGLPALTILAIVRNARGRTRPLAIPRSELAALGTAIKDADQLAADGRVGDGLSCLVAGMRRAQQANQLGRPGGRELAERWQAVLEEYAAEHRIGPTSEIVPAADPGGRGDEVSPAA